MVIFIVIIMVVAAVVDIVAVEQDIMVMVQDMLVEAVVVVLHPTVWEQVIVMMSKD